jgi:hypothetical protein
MKALTYGGRRPVADGGVCGMLCLLKPTPGVLFLKTYILQKILYLHTKID